ncbi:hypothetical protein [Labedaea rhizosphaerae]|uniref:Uncharacterized protein n=1 Tax=Labedaea rhizosphaerae TaxID=598644 RepID=A0A4R6SGS6_LABRH|nr:hypothetical protein [Labedaea rhizosphaerae]TDQ01232.1 hypothetical protein EV186_1021100 [Labedaea rhizosphaerae]
MTEPAAEPVTSAVLDSRPRPILEAIRSGAWVSVLGAALTAAVTFGLLNAEQVTALNNLVAAAATLITAVTAVLHGLHILRAAEPEVTPMSDPRDTDGRPLIPAESGD